MSKYYLIVLLVLISGISLYSETETVPDNKNKALMEFVQIGDNEENEANKNKSNQKIDLAYDAKKPIDVKASSPATVITNPLPVKDIKSNKIEENTPVEQNNISIKEKPYDNTAAKKPAPAVPVTKKEIDITPVLEINELHRNIYSGNLTIDEAKKIFFKNIKLAAKIYWQKGGKKYTKKRWVFPVKGYNYKTSKLSKWDYMHKYKYNYFSSEISGDHPAFDLFIRDENLDFVDDKTNLPVNILSVTGGIVLACVKDWDQVLNSSGGNNLLIYDPYYNSIFYYAHNDKIFVNPGDVVKPGQVIATMGRTGKKAFLPGSPTHLHVSYLLVKKNNLAPVNIYRDLKRMKSIK